MFSISRRRLLAIGTAGAATAALGGAAWAQIDDDDDDTVIEERPRRSRRSRRRRYRYEDEDDVMIERAPRSRCTPLCANDTSPCDPPQMKASDGRCSNPVAAPTF